ncbi:hypothetical protein CRG98_010471 [Punica granatum]|uniref:Uncharacterized protein n=1 Tax=Punica granatum TaxID=22663 RepID=A0A2I0KMS0_PUNGR|nr:hypothetical protein CRG98_010471 [Punica granatum]
MACRICLLIHVYFYVSSNDDEDEDDTMALLEELERIKKEMTEEKLQKATKRSCGSGMVLILVRFPQPASSHSWNHGLYRFRDWCDPLAVTFGRPKADRGHLRPLNP